MYNSYLNKINSQLNLPIFQWDFKSDPDYTGILEHVSPQYGFEYLNVIKNKFCEIYEKHKETLIMLCNKNDLYGKTNKTFFENFTYCSPSNLRYILHSILILDYIKQNDLNNINFIEIGGGYGGLCLFIYGMTDIFNIHINSYTIFDLTPASLLQQKYLSLFKINVNCCQLENIHDLHNNSFLISNYAFSEIDRHLQNEYHDKVIKPFTSHGFLAWNSIPVYIFIENSNIITEEEYPLTGSHNFYVRFAPLA